METMLWPFRWRVAVLAELLMEPMLGIAMEAMMPMTEMTVSISTRLKPSEGWVGRFQLGAHEIGSGLILA